MSRNIASPKDATATPPGPERPEGAVLPDPREPETAEAAEAAETAEDFSWLAGSGPVELEVLEQLEAMRQAAEQEVIGDD